MLHVVHELGDHQRVGHRIESGMREAVLHLVAFLWGELCDGGLSWDGRRHSLDRLG